MDFDGDGIKDILSGNYVTENDQGLSYLYLLKGKSDGTYENAAEILNKDSKPVIAAKTKGGRDTYNDGQICTHPFAADWDADGDLDLIIGNMGGSFSLVLNESQGKDIKFETGASLIKGKNGELLHVGGRHSAPFMIDWDGDGDLDLLSSSATTPLRISMNVGTKMQPEFEPFLTLIEKQEDDASSSYRPWIQDVNNDGKFDVLIGNKYRKDKPNPEFTPEEIEVMTNEWEEKRTTINEKDSPITAKLKKWMLEGKDPSDFFKNRELLNLYRAEKELLNKHGEAKNKFITQIRTGHVWLYLAK